MLDSDLATLYGVLTGNLNKAVSRNQQRFPEDFAFRLSADEHRSLRFQIGILDKPRRGRYRKYRPLAFTEQGVAMLSGVLHSPRAIEVNIAIMRAFVKLRRALTDEASLAARMKKAELALEALDSEQGEQAAAIHDLMAAFRRLTDGGGG